VAKAKAKKEETATTLNIHDPNYHYAEVRIKGVTPLLTDRMTEEAIAKIMGDAEKTPRGAKKARDRNKEYEDSTYRLESHQFGYQEGGEETTGTFGFPASGFRLACRDAARLIDGIAMTEANHAFIPLDEHVPLEFSTRKIRLDKVGGTTPKNPQTVTVRAEFHDWKCILRFKFNADFLTIHQICNLLQHAGNSVGVGAWRVINKGLHGQFEVEDVKVIP